MELNMPIISFHGQAYPTLLPKGATNGVFPFLLFTVHPGKSMSLIVPIPRPQVSHSDVKQPLQDGRTSNEDDDGKSHGYHGSRSMCMQRAQ